MTYKDVHSYTFNLLRFLDPFLNYLAGDTHRATVVEGMTPAPLNRGHDKLAIRNASEAVNERCALATHLIICSGEVWNVKCYDVLATEWKRGVMIGCKTPGTTKTTTDMSFEAAYKKLLSQELKPYEDFLASLNRKPEQQSTPLAVVDEV